MSAKLLLGDCLELMKDIPDASVDMVLADLPYGTTANKWDSPLPLPRLWEHYWRVLRPTGVVALFGSEPFNSALRTSQPDCFRYDWIWQKEHRRHSGFQHAKNKPLLGHEVITIFSRAKMGHATQVGENRMPYNPQGLTPLKKKRKVEPSKHQAILGARPNQVGKQYKVEWTNYPFSCLYFDSDTEGLHPTQKPVALLEYLIKTYTNPGETVLDNTMGSGSTGVACANTGRKFIGIEKDPKYFEIAEKRIFDAFPPFVKQVQEPDSDG